MLSPEEVAARFAGPVRSLRPFGTGHINRTFLVETPAGDIVLQGINTAVFTDPAAVTANILTVIRHGGGALLPEPVPANGGDFLVTDGPEAWRAWRRVPGAPRAASEATIADLSGAGALLGRFHRLVAGLDPNMLTETLPGFHDPARRLAALRAAVAADPCDRAATVQDLVALAGDAEPLAGLAADLTARVPRRVAHFDAKLDNILFAGGDAVCLVDLDTLMPGAWFWDVGDLLRSGATPAAEDEPDGSVADPERYRAILDGYRAGLAAAGGGTAGGGTAGGGSAAGPAELEALQFAGAIVTYEQAVRFLTDWIAGDVYYRTHRPGQNLDRARAQFRLLASLPRP